jgi:hypothetical protein
MTNPTNDYVKLADKGRITTLRSSICAYCAVPFSATVRPTLEHAVGRKFVPKLKLSAQWNLHVLACSKCNGTKAELEDDISVISMLGGPDGRGPVDPILISEIQRKARRAISRKTRKPVAHSAETVTIEHSFGPFNMKFGFSAPAQIQTERIRALAWFHVQAFAFFTSYDASARRGNFLHEKFDLLAHVSQADWGNVKLRWFTEMTARWFPLLRADAADAYFKIVVRRRSKGERLWSWALEWNRTMRVVGFYGDDELVKSLIAQTPEVSASFVHQQEGETIIGRENVRLADEDDLLFDWADFETSHE